MEYNRKTRLKFTNENCKPVYDKNGDIVMDRELFDLLCEGHNCLWEIENKIEQGKMIELPCKVGDTVYAVKKKALRTHWDGHRYIVDDWDEWKVCELQFSLTLWECGGILGKDYYLTREEAEKKLKELQE
jgi:hypothetical protein